MSLPVRRRRTDAAVWDPFREIEELYDRVASLVPSVSDGASWVPLADVEETDDAYSVELDLPGAVRDDVDVEIDDRVLRVSGEIHDKKRRGLLHRRTRRMGTFHYTVTLPAEVDDEHVEARLADGVLTVRVPKAEHARRRRIPIAR